MATMTSQKIGRKNGGAGAHHFTAPPAEPHGMVIDRGHATPRLILNFGDGHRMWTLALTGEETAQLAASLSSVRAT